MDLRLPFQVLSGCWQSAVVVVQNESACPEDIVLHVGCPVDLTHVKIERLFIFLRQLVVQLNEVFTNETPLVCGKVFVAFENLVHSVIQSNLMKEKALRN